MLLDPVRLSRMSRGAARRALLAGKAPARSAWRRWVTARGVDDTAGSATRSCLVLSPHPDDETIGCGATIARKRAVGTEVWVVVVTDGRHSHRSEVIAPLELAARRAAESVAACRLLGVEPDHVRFLGFEELSLDRCLDEVSTAIGALIDELAPDEILVSSALDWNPDHRAVNEAARRAVTATGRRFDGLAAEYPVWFWADGPWRAAPWDGVGAQLRTVVHDPLAALRLARPSLVSTEGFVERKRVAFGEYASQVRNLTGETTWPVFPHDWIEPFLGPWELFFPLERHARHTGLTSPDRPGATAAARASEAMLVDVRDEFGDDRLAGTVIGSRATSGAERLGVDAECTIGIDDGALRLATLATPGFGRQGLAYGPFARTAGLTVVVQVLNSHNTAQSDILPEGRKSMVRRMVREFPEGRVAPPHIDDNLVVGFFPEPAPPDPRRAGNAFTMHAASTVNGELRARVGGGQLRSYQGIQEVPLTYVVTLRERGARYFVSSVPGAAGAAAFPAMRPVAVDHASHEAVVFAGLQQAVHGEVGHDIATRVSRIEARVVPELGVDCAWVLNDDLAGDGPLAGDGSTPGGLHWATVDGPLQRNRRGVEAAGPGGGAAVTELPWPAGLVHVVVETPARFPPEARAGLIWRAGPAGAWRVLVGADSAHLARRDGGPGAPWCEVAAARAHLPAAGRWSLQVADDGHQFGIHLDGQLLFDRWFTDGRYATQRGAGPGAGPPGGVALADFEALPREVPLPGGLDLVAPWHEQGTTVASSDDFAGPVGELDGPWERSVGAGRFERTGRRAGRVVADRDHPNPGRTAYTVACPDPSFVDIEVELTPPGTARGQGHNGRGGLVIFQDPDTYLVVNMWLDDAPHHDGSSVSMFFRCNGYERLYDAVWTNVARRVRWGCPFMLRLTSDGRQVMVWLDGEPILYRRLRDIYPSAGRMRLQRAGVAANWEWGDDTGTEFRRFVLRTR